MARLGAPFKIVDNDLRPFRVEVAKRIAALNTTIGKPADASIAAADRARVRTQVAREFFLAEHGREPIDARELTGQIAKDSRPRTQTVAGLRPDVLPGEVGVDLVGGRRPGGGGCDRTGPSGRSEGRFGVHRDACAVHPDRTTRDPAGQRTRPGRDRVHPPGQPGRRPRSAHPRRGREQGADPRRTLAVDRRPGAVQSQRGRLGDLQHRPGAAPSRARWGCGSRNGPAPTRRSGRSGRSSVSTPD